MLKKVIHYASLTAIFAFFLGIFIAVLFVLLAAPKLPSLDKVIDYQPRVPLRVYSRGDILVGEFGVEKRSLIELAELPLILKQAILAAEDDRFYQHRGVDYRGILRAALINIAQGGKRQGASTITMQVARNFFLSRERSFARKLFEVLLAFKIEYHLTKDEIFSLYINQIYLGERSYGFAQAAETYYQKPISELSLSEAATLAGLPKAPSIYNPFVNPKRAKQRQLYVLNRMLQLQYVDQIEYEIAAASPVPARPPRREANIHAEYVAEMARQYVDKHFPSSVIARGLKVYTTIDPEHQNIAYQALRRGLLNYDRRHGYRGPEGFVTFPHTKQARWKFLADELTKYQSINQLHPAIVTQVFTDQIEVFTQNQYVTIHKHSLHLIEEALANRSIQPGAIIRVIQHPQNQWEVSQLPEIQGAFVSADPNTGAIKALVGGFDFYSNQFNHVTQAWRQPGSSIKPFIFAAALSLGFSPESIFEDAPITYPPQRENDEPWSPKNYDERYSGFITLRTALAKSKNMVSVRLLDAIRPSFAQDYLTNFGFSKQRNPPYLTMALGAGSSSPIQLLAAYSVFANGGYYIRPYFIEKITDTNGHTLYQHPPPISTEKIRVIPSRIAFLINSMMQDVIQYGTGRKANLLARSDIAGKTGTTNNYIDAWFCGYQPTLAAITWVGYDKPTSLGPGETGSRTALPVWIDYMRFALEKKPTVNLPPPRDLLPYDLLN